MLESQMDSCDDLFDALKYRRTVNEYGVIRYYNANDVLHREDGPAEIYPNGFQAWYIDGWRHRTDGPAVTYSSEGLATGARLGQIGHGRAWYIEGVEVASTDPRLSHNQNKS